MDTNSIIAMLQNKLPKNQAEHIVLRDKLDKMSEAKRDEFAKTTLLMLNLKSPTKVFWLGSFLFGTFGVGRFMIGDKVLGGIRLALFLLIIVAGMLGFAIVSSVLNVISWIWWIVDLFIVGPKLRRQNLAKVLQAIG